MSKQKPVFIGPRIKRLRRDLGLTQAQMAADIEISASYVALIERNQRTQQRLDEITSEHQRLMAALTPFAEFAESPELRMGHPEKVVLESNKGRPSYKRVTVGDFRRALDAMRELEKGPGS